MLKRWKQLQGYFFESFNFSYLKFRLWNENKLIHQFLNSPGLEKTEIGFSVVVPVYGIPLDMVKAFFNSVKKQSYSRWEICVCDDGDPDPQIQSYLDQEHKSNPTQFKLIRNSRNEGITQASKKALQLATQEYVVLADSDDLLHPKALEVFRRAIEFHGAPDFLYSNHDYMSEWGHRLHPMSKPGWSPELLLHVNYINHLKVIRTSFLRDSADLCFDDTYSGAQDWNLCFQILKSAEKVVHVPFFLYHWRSRKGSMAESFMAKPWAVEAQFKLRSHFIEELNPQLKFDFNENSVALKSNELSVEHFDLNHLHGLDLFSGWNRVWQTIQDSNRDFLHFGFSQEMELQSTEKLAAYASLPRVAFVWGFNDSLVRTNYTMTELKKDQVQLQQNRFLFGPYSHYSGNVLAGPLPGALIEVKKAKKLIPEKCPLSRQDHFEGREFDLLGLLMSFEALKNSYRNVSISTVLNKYQSAPVHLPPHSVPSRNPYLT